MLILNPFDLARLSARLPGAIGRIDRKQTFPFLVVHNVFQGSACQSPRSTRLHLHELFAFALAISGGKLNIFHYCPCQQSFQTKYNQQREK